MKGFADKIAIVTGGASGYGRALCEELARARTVVIVADLDGEGASRVAKALTDGGGRASAVPVDVGSADGVQEMVRATLAEHGRIDLMFNNAGISWSGEFQEMAVPDADRIVDINLNGVLYGALAVYPIMVKQGAGHIVNTSSCFSGLIPVPRLTVYSATKNAVVGFSLALRQEARWFGVNVSVVCPSFIRSNIDATSSAILRGQAASVPSPLPATTPETTRLARAILKGVSRNRSIIIRPAFIRVFWWLYRASPWLFYVLFYPTFMRTLGRGQRSRVVSIALGPARWLFKLLLGPGKGKR